MDVAKVWRVADLVGCLALYVCVGPALILVNKQIMTAYGFGCARRRLFFGKVREPVRTNE